MSNIIIINEFFVDIKNESKCDGTSDHACIPTEDELPESDAVLPAKTKYRHETYCCKSSSDYDDTELSCYKTGRNWIGLIISKYSNAQVAKDECLKRISEKFETIKASLLAFF